jgi:hypothetical protein
LTRGLPLSFASCALRQFRSRNAQHAKAEMASINSRLHLPLRRNAIILAIKVDASPVGVRQYKLPP